ncbi:MAG: preprotein translocase subunit SecY [Candidatus Aenigmatarchaeota archaeon]
MKLGEIAERIYIYLPTVVDPLYKISIREKLKWTILILFAYFFLSYVPIVGLSLSPQAQYFITLQHLLGARFGSLLTLGIGPIVTAGIILQLLVGSKIINLDTTTKEGRKKFEMWNKTLAFVLAFVEAAAYVFLGPLHTITIFLPLVIFQIALGGILVILFDEAINKWGIGSGVSLFIMAGIASQIFIRIFSPFPSGCSINTLSACIPSLNNPPVGLFWQFLINFYNNNPTNALLAFFPILSTAIVFLLVVYIQAINIEIPLAFSMFKGFGRAWSLKLLYTSNIPVIFMWALLMNIQMMGRIGLQEVSPGKYCNFFGCYDSNGNPISGIVYYISAPRGIVNEILYGTNFKTLILHFFVYSLIMIVGCILFSVIWVNTSGMDAKSIAEQLYIIGMQVPGYRRDPRVIESVLNKYISPLSVLSGFFIGVLTIIADWLGAIGSGTGLLLAVTIAYNTYEIIKNEDLEGAPKILLNILGEGK